MVHDDVIKWNHFPRYWPFVRSSPVTGEFPAQRPVTRSFDVFFDLRLCGLVINRKAATNTARHVPICETNCIYLLIVQSLMTLFINIWPSVVPYVSITLAHSNMSLFFQCTAVLDMIFVTDVKAPSWFGWDGLESIDNIIDWGRGLVYIPKMTPRQMTQSASCI